MKEIIPIKLQCFQQEKKKNQEDISQLIPDENIRNTKSPDRKGLGYSSLGQCSLACAKPWIHCSEYQAKNQKYRFLSQGNIDLTRNLD